ncbi:AAA family ATPase [Pyxidicoccus sp. 3LG]
MLLKTLTYQDKKTGWTLQDLKLDRFNLLVGASGVGKTRILRAIRQLRATAYGRALIHSGRVSDIGADAAISFVVAFDHEEQGYSWEFESETRSIEEPVDSSQQATSPLKTLVAKEKLSSTTDGVLIQRDRESFLFLGKELPQLSPLESGLVLLDEPVIRQARQALVPRILDEQSPRTFDSIPERTAEALLTRMETLDDLRGLIDPSAIVKAFVLQERFPEQFDYLKRYFIEIFPAIEDISITKMYFGVPQDSRGRSLLLSFELKETGVAVRIPGQELSSGMIRTLTQLIDLWLAPAGTVVLIDEFENSLGVNCMGPLTDFIQSRASELQFIITSHHPYIINKIPKDHWKVVRRKGSVVRVTPATEIKALQGTSAQDDFTRLLNSPEFEEGLA